MTLYRSSWSFNWGWLQSAGTRNGTAELDGERGTAFWIRLFDRGVQFKGPGTRKFFSERFGYKKAFLTFRGWRLFWLEK